MGPIDVTIGERFRLRFVNSTMMAQLIHLHGTWMELENGQGEHRPYFHTISVLPSTSVSALVTRLTTGHGRGTARCSIISRRDIPLPPRAAEGGSRPSCTGTGAALRRQHILRVRARRQHAAGPFSQGLFDQLEGHIGDGSYLRWDGQAWIGDDHNRLWLKSEGRYNPANRDRMKDGDHEVLYSGPISPNFDVQASVRVDLDSSRTRTWAALGI